METKNNFLWLVLSVFLLTSIGCENLRVRQDRPSLPGEPIPQAEVEPEGKPVLPPAEARPPEFIKQQRAKIGLILGPGGALSYAHIGFLQELENQKIPVHAIAGMEWGALVAATYAALGKAHGVEWKLLKFPANIFEKKGFFGASKSAPEISAADGFLKETFSGKVVSRGALGFACPYVELKQMSIRLAQDTTYEERMRKCWPHPPLFQLNRTAANLTGLSQAAQALRALGADKIIYVDVLSQNQLGPIEATSDRLLWALARGQNLKGVDEIVQIQIPGGGLGQFSEARSLIRQGQLKSKAIAQDLGRRYAL